MPVWYNQDGLLVKTGREEGFRGRAGEYRTNGPVREDEISLNLTPVGVIPGLTTTYTIIDDNVIVGKNCNIESIDIFTEVAATSGGAATLDIGLVRLDRTTEIDYDGLIAQLPLSAINTAGTRVTYTKGTSGAGALVGAPKLTFPGHFIARVNAAVYTAGKILVRVRYSWPTQVVGS